MKALFRLAPALVVAGLAAPAPRMAAQSDPGAAIAVAADNADASTKSAAAHTAMIIAWSKKAFYTKKFDLSGLPEYAPSRQVTGTVFVVGNNYIGDSYVGRWWKEQFEKYQPGVTVKYYLPSAAVAFPALEFGGADMVLDHRGLFYDYLSFERMYGYDPLDLVALTGSYNVRGWDNAPVIVVNRANPLSRLTMKQLDDIFGSERAGGWDNTTWRPDWARGPEEDIRTWGQLGLAGDWADKPIQTYGFSVRYSAAITFSNRVLKGSDKWNGNLLAYGNYKGADGKEHVEADQIAAHVEADPYGIGYLLYTDAVRRHLKVLSLAQSGGGPYVQPSIDSLQDSSYPLAVHMHWYVNVKPGMPLKPALREFLKYVLSRQGQEVIERDGKYLPLNAEIDREDLAKIQ